MYLEAGAFAEGQFTSTTHESRVSSFSDFPAEPAGSLGVFLFPILFLGDCNQLMFHVPRKFLCVGSQHFRHLTVH